MESSTRVVKQTATTGSTLGKLAGTTALVFFPLIVLTNLAPKFSGFALTFAVVIFLGMLVLAFGNKNLENQSSQLGNLARKALIT